MFRARKPSVQRTPTAKHVPPDIPIIKPEPRAMVDHINVKPKPQSAIDIDIKQPKTSPLSPQLPPLPLPQHNTDRTHAHLPPAPHPETYEAEADLRHWQKKTEYKPWHMDVDDDEHEEDLIREVRKDRKIAPENDPLFAQIFAMFPEEEAAQ